MKKLLVLLVGGLVFTMLATAQQSTPYVACAAAGPITAQGSGGLSCAESFVIPSGATLSSISYELVQDSSVPANGSSTVTGSYTGSGTETFTESITETSGGVTFGPCSATGSSSASSCPVFFNYTNLSQAGPGTFSGTETVNYTLTYGNGGVATNGSTGLNLYVSYDYNVGIPEPATLGITGAGFLALGLIARKRRNRKA